ncbi:MAG: DUF222 domain-containing protein [Ilumatobacter sp.]
MSEVLGDTLVDDSAVIGAVDDVFASAAGHLNVQHARLVSAAVWMLDNVGSWQGDGLWTPGAYVRWRTGVSQATAAKIVAVAQRSAELPQCIAAMQRGELSLDQMAPIAQRAPAWCDEQMSRLAPRLTVAQISKVARAYPWSHSVDDATCEPCDAGDAGDVGDVGDAGQVDAFDSASTHHQHASPVDSAWFGWDDNGRFRLHADLSQDTGSLVEAALTEARDKLFNAGMCDVDTVDALVEVTQRSLDAIPSPERRSRYRVNFHMNELGAVTDSRGRTVDPATSRRVGCDALVTPVRFANGVPVSVGRSQHIVPDRTRRLVEHRDQGCRVPGCHMDRFIEVHHIVHWASGGPTDTWNLICLCPKHHRVHHQGRLGITGNADTADGVIFADRHGSVLSDPGARPWPPGAAPPPINGTYEHPVGERLDTRWLYFNDDPARPAPLSPSPSPARCRVQGAGCRVKPNVRTDDPACDDRTNPSTRCKDQHCAVSVPSTGAEPKSASAKNPPTPMIVSPSRDNAADPPELT